MIRACLNRIASILLPQRFQCGQSRQLSQRATRGETITEALVSVLIGGLALLMLAGAISSAFHIITNSEKNMDAQYALNNNIVDGVSATTTAEGSLALSGGVVLDGVTGGPGVSVDYSIYDISGSQAIVTYK